MDKTNGSIIGTGFFLEGFIVTCWHVVAKEAISTMDTIKVDANFVNGYKIRCGIFQRSSIKDDLCVLLPIDDNCDFHPFVTMTYKHSSDYAVIPSQSTEFQNLSDEEKENFDSETLRCYVVVSAESFQTISAAKQNAGKSQFNINIGNIINCESNTVFCNNHFAIIYFYCDAENYQKLVQNMQIVKSGISFLPNLLLVSERKQGDCIKIGCKVKTCGFPIGDTPTIARGEVNNIVTGREIKEISENADRLSSLMDDDVTFIMNDAAIEKGNSGGPLVLHDRECVLGVVGFDRINFNFATHVKHLRSLIKEAKTKIVMQNRFEHLVQESHIENDCLFINATKCFV